MVAGNDGPSAFGARLRSSRVSAGMTQEMLAARSGVSVDAISALESGRRQRPHPSTVAMLADGLALDAEERARLAAATRLDRRAVAQPPSAGKAGVSARSDRWIISRRTSLAMAAAGIGVVTLAATEWFAHIVQAQPRYGAPLEAELSAVRAAAHVLPAVPDSGALRVLVPPDESPAVAAQRIDGIQQYRIDIRVRERHRGGPGTLIEGVALLLRDVHAVPEPLAVLQSGASMPPPAAEANPYTARYEDQMPGAVIPAGYDSEMPRARVRIEAGETDALTVAVVSNSPAHLWFQVRLQCRAAGDTLVVPLILPYGFEVVFSDARNWHAYERRSGRYVPI